MSERRSTGAQKLRTGVCKKAIAPLIGGTVELILAYSGVANSLFTFNANANAQHLVSYNTFLAMYRNLVLPLHMRRRLQIDVSQGGEGGGGARLPEARQLEIFRSFHLGLREDNPHLHNLCTHFSSLIRKGRSLGPRIVPLMRGAPVAT